MCVSRVYGEEKSCGAFFVHVQVHFRKGLPMGPTHLSNSFRLRPSGGDAMTLDATAFVQLMAANLQENLLNHTL